MVVTLLKTTSGLIRQSASTALQDAGSAYICWSEAGGPGFNPFACMRLLTQQELSFGCIIAACSTVPDAYKANRELTVFIRPY